MPLLTFFAFVTYHLYVTIEIIDNCYLWVLSFAIIDITLLTFKFYLWYLSLLMFWHLRLRTFVTFDNWVTFATSEFCYLSSLGLVNFHCLHIWLMSNFWHCYFWHLSLLTTFDICHFWVWSSLIFVICDFGAWAFVTLFWHLYVSSTFVCHLWHLPLLSFVTHEMCLF